MYYRRVSGNLSIALRQDHGGRIARTGRSGRRVGQSDDMNPNVTCERAGNQ
jgi:hypothetical protein